MIKPSKQRMAADNQFLKLQTQSLARGRITSDMDSIIQQRVENTVRLKGLRLAKEAQDRATALTSLAIKKIRRKAAQ